ncbi:MAG: sigma-70 family RNA polymerase sigma factor [Phycisphaerales bacterium]
MNAEPPVLQLIPVDSDAPPIALKRGEPNVVGRGSGACVPVDDPAVSRTHARIEVRDGRWRYVDTSGGSGSWVDGVHIAPDEDAEIGDGTHIRVGPRVFVARTTEPHTEDHRVPETHSADAADAPAAARAPAAGSAPASASAPASDSARAADPYATRPSIFLRLRADGTLDKQLGWQEFHERYAPVIAGFARNAGLKPGEIDDVVQDVMFGFFRASNAFEYDPQRGRFRGYLKRVTLNAIRDRWRRRRKEVTMPEEFDPAMEDPMDRQWERDWSENLLRRAMDEVRTRVQPRTMEAFELYGVKGLPAETVEKETGMTYAAIRHAKMRVLHDLQEVVRRLRAEEG